jgi:membrane protease YdiL (CAAX protease family)
VGVVAVGRVEERPNPGKLTWWWILVGVLAVLAYAGRASGGRPPDDVLYHWDTALFAAIVYAVVLGLLLLIARGDTGLFALRPPRSWARALGWAFVVFVVILLIGAGLDPFLDAGEEQGLTPTSWDPDRAAPFFANAVVIAGLAPVVEELTYRGLGFSLLRPYGMASAIIGVGLAFGLAHGLIEALPILSLFGIGLAWLRERTDSVYPPILLHAVFNGFALAVSVAV